MDYMYITTCIFNKVMSRDTRTWTILLYITINSIFCNLLNYCNDIYITVINKYSCIL